MEAKWPFFLITFSLIFALGLIIAGLERSGVMNNWQTRRCELPVMMAAMFFKPDSDPRTKSDFASENFEFCMKSYVDKFMALLMAPVNMLFGKQADIASSAVGMVDTIRQIAATLYNTLSSYLEQYYLRFNASIYEISRVIQYLRMAFRRANGMMMSMLYSGITMFRGMLNTIQFVIQVILIICGIMLAIIIILFFVLFPVIPLILSVLGAIIGTVLALTTVMSGDIANQASSDKSGFCFAENTKILVKKDNKEILTSVKDIKLDDELINGSKITAVIQMDGKGVQLYNINGILVSGSHLILGTDGHWKSVSKDERAKKVDNTSDILYCFNTTTHNIPVYSPELNRSIIFKDWEEIDDKDIKGQYLWSYNILKMLNNNLNYRFWKYGIKPSDEIPLVGRRIKVKTSNGFVEIEKIKLFDNILDKKGKEQCIIGIVYAIVNELDDDGKWNTELYELMDSEVWIKGTANFTRGDSNGIGIALITETGEFTIWDEIEEKEKIVRDFTEVGHTEIHKTYPLVASRLRLFRNTNEII
jgi:hypothetical protein